MISINQSKNLLLNNKTIKIYKSEIRWFFSKSELNFNKEINKNSHKKRFTPNINLNKASKFPFIDIISKRPKQKSLFDLNKKSCSDKTLQDYNKNNSAEKDQNSNKANTNNFYIDEYFFPAITQILLEINKNLKNIEIENFLSENKCFEKLYKLFMEVLKKGEDNLFPYLTLIIEISKANQVLKNMPNKISVILTENKTNLKRKYICLAILNQIYTKIKQKENKENDKNEGFENSFKNKVYAGGLYEKVMSQNDPKNPNDFEGTLIITKNYTDAIEYYETLRRFDKEGKIKIKKFGSSFLGIRGLSLKNEKSLVESFIDIEKEIRNSENWTQ